MDNWTIYSRFDPWANAHKEDYFCTECQKMHLVGTGSHEKCKFIARLAAEEQEALDEIEHNLNITFNRASGEDIWSIYSHIVYLRFSNIKIKNLDAILLVK